MSRGAVACVLPEAALVVPLVACAARMGGRVACMQHAVGQAVGPVAQRPTNHCAAQRNPSAVDAVAAQLLPSSMPTRPRKRSQGICGRARAQRGTCRYNPQAM